MSYQPFRIEKRNRGACDTATIATFPAPSVASVALSQRVPGRKTGHECCRCGEPATMGVGWFLRQPESARWFCGACVPVSGRA